MDCLIVERRRGEEISDAIIRLAAAHRARIGAR
jgi:hypothetical protein